MHVSALALSKLFSAHVMDVLLFIGKGAFGKVFEAKAVGIIPDTPERNVVAVKMVKGQSEANITLSHIDI